MPIDEQALNKAAKDVIKAARDLRGLSNGMIKPVAGTTLPHAATIATLKVEAGGDTKTAWETARDALDAALNI